MLKRLVKKSSESSHRKRIYNCRWDSLSIYIIAENEKGEGRLYDFSEINIDNLIKELIQDIESDLTGWSMFYCGCDDEEEIKVNREFIRNLICQLKEKLWKEIKII